MINLLILPALRNRKVADVTRADVCKLHHSLRKTPYQANRVLALVSKMMNLAEKWGLRSDGSNPCRHVEKYKEAKRERFLSAEELTRLGDVLSEAERTATEVAERDRGRSAAGADRLPPLRGAYAAVGVRRFRERVPTAAGQQDRREDRASERARAGGVGRCSSARRARRG